MKRHLQRKYIKYLTRTPSSDLQSKMKNRTKRQTNKKNAGMEEVEYIHIF